jgi:hypothetical protein
MTILPAGCPSTVMSKNTLGLVMLIGELVQRFLSVTGRRRSFITVVDEGGDRNTNGLDGNRLSD